MRKKVGIYKVYFYDNTGSTSTVFKKLNKAVTKNGYLTLPELHKKAAIRQLDGVQKRMRPKRLIQRVRRFESKKI